MRRRVLIDAGPLVAFLKRQDQFHGWVADQWATIKPPLLFQSLIGINTELTPPQIRQTLIGIK